MADLSEQFPGHPTQVIRPAKASKANRDQAKGPLTLPFGRKGEPSALSYLADPTDSLPSRARRWVVEHFGVKTRAFRRLVWAAKSGDADAQYRLGEIYLTGRGAPCYPLLAAKWLSQAASQGHSGACHSLSLLYSAGVKAHAPAATYADANRQGNVIALYAEGFDIKPDSTRAFQLAKSAAQQGHPAAQGNLGLMYLQGFGCNQDYKKAARWSRFAAVQHDAAGALGLGMLHEHGLGMPVNLAEAARWYCIAADQGNDRAATALGLLMLDGRGVDQDIKQAQRLLSGPAARGDDIAKQALARSRSIRRFGT